MHALTPSATARQAHIILLHPSIACGMSCRLLRVPGVRAKHHLTLMDTLSCMCRLLKQRPGHRWHLMTYACFRVNAENMHAHVQVSWLAIIASGAWQRRQVSVAGDDWLIQHSTSEGAANSGIRRMLCSCLSVALQAGTPPAELGEASPEILYSKDVRQTQHQ